MMAEKSALIATLAKSTGVAESDVSKVLDELGLEKHQEEIVRFNNGQAIDPGGLRVAFRVGRTLLVM